MKLPTKTPVRSNAHTLGRIPRIGLGYIFGNNQFRGNHMFDLAGEAAPLLDGKDESEQSRCNQLRRMQMVAIGIRNIAGFDGLPLLAGKQVAVRHGRTSQFFVHPLVPSGAYRASSVDSDTKIPPPVYNREGA